MDQVTPHDTLLIVDVQRDFLPGGALPVKEGDAVVPVLNHCIDRFSAAGRPVFATRDWHPPDHCSFQPQGGPWPVHCVAHTEGAAFAPDLRLPADAVIVSKGTARDREAYSGFEGTDLEEQLRRHQTQRLWVGGLATDYCVLNTVRDALERGFEVLVLTDAIRAVDREPGDGRRACETMRRLGAQFG